MSSKATLSPVSPPTFPAIRSSKLPLTRPQSCFRKAVGNFYTPQLGGLWSRPTSKRGDKARLGTRAGGWSARHLRFPVLPEGAVLTLRPGSLHDPNRPRQGPPPEGSHAASTAYTPRTPVPLSAPTALLRGSWPPTNGHTLVCSPGIPASPREPRRAEQRTAAWSGRTTLELGSGADKGTATRRDISASVLVLSVKKGKQNRNSTARARGKSIQPTDKHTGEQ